VVSPTKSWQPRTANLVKKIIVRAVIPGLMSLAAVAWLIAYSPTKVGGAGPVIPIGDVMVSIGNGEADEFTPAGTFVQTLNTGHVGATTTGSAFDSSGNFWLTRFDAGLTEFDPTGALIGDAAAPSAPESVLFDAAGHIWLGQADLPRTILELSSNGSTQINAFTVTTGPRGTDWIDLSADQCTMHYTSEGFDVLSYNVCTNTQNANFNAATLPNRAFAHRILPFAVGTLPAGSELVADTSEVAVLNNAGVKVRDDTAVGAGGGVIFALNLDPDGTSYWTADAVAGKVFRVDIATGTVLTSWSAGSGEGLSVKGQITAALPTPTATPTATSTGGATPTPTPAAMASGAPPLNITSAPGATVTAGTLMVTNNSGATMVTPKVTISFGNADLFSSATVTGVVGDSQSKATVTPLSGGNSPEQANSTDFNLTLHVPNGQTATYTLMVTVSNNPKTTMRRSPVKYAAMIPGEGFGGSGGFLASMLLLSLGTTLVAKSRPRRMFFVLVILMLAVTSQVGCDNGSGGSGGESGSGGGGGGKVPTSMQTVEGVTATNTDGGPIIVSGLPIVLSTIKVP
jgi:hypothetical protein